MNLKKKFKKAVRVALAVLTAFGALSLSPITSTVYAANVDYGSLSTLAQGHIGATYSTGSRLGPNSFDCSGLVDYVWNEAGIGSDPLSGGWTTATWHNYLMGMAGVTYTDTTQDSYSPGDVHAGDIIMWYNDADKTSISNNNPYHMGIMVNSTQMVSAATHSIELGHAGVVINNIVGGTSGGHYQYNPLDKGGSGYIRIFHMPSTKQISVNINKQSMYPDCTNGNALYSLAGAEFSVTASDGTDLGTLTTDANGNASQTYNVSYNVDSVTITETKAPDNYKITDGTPKVVTLDNNNTASYTVADEPINDPAYITLTKVDKEGKAVASSMCEAQFTITYYDTWNDSELTDAHKKAEWVIKTTAVTNGSNTMYVARLDDEHFVSGSALYKNSIGAVIIPLGTITIQETQEPSGYTKDGGYLLNNDTKEIVSSTDTMTFKIVNENSAAVMKAGNLVADGIFIKEELPIRGGFKLQKNDSEYWTRAQGDATLAGAEFDLFYLGGGVSGTDNTGMKLDTDGDGIGDGTEYQPSETTAIAHIVVDENGYYETSDKYLAVGKYRIVETKAPTGYSTDGDTSVEFTITTDQEMVDITKNIKNRIDYGKFSIYKITSETTSDFATPEEGVEFTAILASKIGEGKAYATYEDAYKAIEEAGKSGDVMDADGNVILSVREYSVITTDKNGMATSDWLAYGTYTIRQTSHVVETVDVTNEATFQVTKDKQETVPYTATNTPNKYRLELYKLDADTQQKVTLNSAEFKVFQLTDRKGKEVNKYVTQKVGLFTYDTFKTNSDNSGLAVVNGLNGVYDNTDDEKGTVTTPLQLEAGTYRIEEITTPDGYLLNEEPIEFEIKESTVSKTDKDGDAVVVVEFKNNKPHGTLEITKNLEEWENDQSLLPDDFDYSTIKFELRAKEDIKDVADGTTYVAKGNLAKDVYGNEVGSITLNSNGTATVENLPMGNYTLKEVSVPEGVVLSDTEYDVTFKQEDNKQEHKTYKVVFEDGATPTEWVDGVKITSVNDTIVNKVTKLAISKTDVTGEKELAGATLTIKDEEGNIVKDANGNDLRWVSGDDEYLIEGLHTDTLYTLVEEIAVEGYVKATDINFSINEDGSVTKVHMVDKRDLAEKEDMCSALVEGAEITVYELDEKGNVITGEDGNPIVVDTWTTSNISHYSYST